jgi:glycolate oxidase FAD binding subunit
MDQSAEFAARLADAAARRAPVRIRAGGTKDFYGQAFDGELFDPRGHTGIIDYEPTELVVTVRAGTRLADLEAALSARDQLLPFEPPHFGAAATVGGCVAAGLAGPRRAANGPVSGSVRDFMLGCRLLDGRGQRLSFGGTVMKNVAGYDVARALAGSLGTLGLLLDLSLKVLPRPAAEATLRFELDEPTALHQLNTWAGQPLPISASAWCGGTLALRLSGARAAVRSAAQRLGGETVASEPADAFWSSLREQTATFFAGDLPLWRLSLPSTAAPVGAALAGDDGAGQLIEWGGAQRWLRTRAAVEQVRARAATLGGHATVFRTGAGGASVDRAGGVFTPLSPPLLAIHRRLKAEFDPAGILNPGRMFAGL